MACVTLKRTFHELNNLEPSPKRRRCGGPASAPSTPPEIMAQPHSSSCSTFLFSKGTSKVNSGKFRCVCLSLFAVQTLFALCCHRTTDVERPPGVETYGKTAETPLFSRWSNVADEGRANEGRAKVIAFVFAFAAIRCIIGKRFCHVSQQFLGIYSSSSVSQQRPTALHAQRSDHDSRTTVEGKGGGIERGIRARFERQIGRLACEPGEP